MNARTLPILNDTLVIIWIGLRISGIRIVILLVDLVSKMIRILTVTKITDSNEFDAVAISRIQFIIEIMWERHCTPKLREQDFDLSIYFGSVLITMLLYVQDLIDVF